MKPIPTPEEAKALKEARKARKAQYGNVNLPVVEMRIPWQTETGKEIDLDRPPWDSLPDALEHGWRVSQFLRDQKHHDEQVTRRIIRT